MLGEGHSIQMETAFSDASRLLYVLRPASSEAITVSLQPFSVVIDIPRTQLMSWANADVITLESRQANGTHSGLTILVEKDFHCLHRDTAEDADTFPNPKLQ